MNYIQLASNMRINLDQVVSYTAFESEEGQFGIEFITNKDYQCSAFWDKQEERDQFLQFLDGVALWRQPFNFDPGWYDPNTPNIAPLFDPNNHPCSD